MRFLQKPMALHGVAVRTAEQEQLFRAGGKGQQMALPPELGLSPYFVLMLMFRVLMHCSKALLYESPS